MNKIKKLSLGLLLGLAVGAAFFAINPAQASIQNQCKYGQCQAIAKSTGKQCKHCVSNPGDAYCFQHK